MHLLYIYGIIVAYQDLKKDSAQIWIVHFFFFVFLASTDRRVSLFGNVVVMSFIA